MHHVDNDRNDPLLLQVLTQRRQRLNRGCGRVTGGMRQSWSSEEHALHVRDVPATGKEDLYTTREGVVKLT